MLRVLSPNHLTIAGRCLSVSRFSLVGKQVQSGDAFSFDSHCRLDTSYTTTRKRRFKSTAAAGEGGDSSDNNSSTIRPLEPSAISSSAAKEIHRLKHIRNVGILAHVDAGKTTVTERMLALAGVVRSAGSVDNGNTVTDYLPAERERGITIQSAAVSFNWGWHNNRRGNDYEANDNVKIQLIDTPGHVDFSVEVNRSVAVLDGAVLVVDAVAGVQAQTETVWRALTKPSWNNHELPRSDTVPQQQTHEHEPLPCLAIINKMDKDGCHFGKAIASLRHKLPGANPIATQMPLFRETTGNGGARQKLRGGRDDNDNSMKNPEKICSSIIAVPADDVTTALGEFVGVVDLIHMRAIVWPENMNATPNGGLSNVENCVPKVINLLKPQSREPIDPQCRVTKQAIAARCDFVEALAEVDPKTEEYYLNDEEPSNAELRAGLRRATLSRKALPVMAGAAVRGLGIEPLLDSIADLLPSPLDRLPPALTKLENSREEGAWANKKRSARKSNNKAEVGNEAETSASPAISQDAASQSAVTLGHPLHPSLIALAFKVVHMKGRGGSGDGRVVFARVYSGTLKDRDAVKVISPPAPGEISAKPRVERIGGMLELSGGRFDNIDNGICSSGEVCALVGLKGVVTGDTIYVVPDDKMAAKSDVVCLAGVSSPKPVLTVRLEVATSDQQTRLSDALALLAIEDPSLKVEESDAATLLSGLGELHIEVTLDRLWREYGLEVMAGTPAVTYRETITHPIESDGLVEYDRTIGGTRLQAAVQLVLEPNLCQRSVETGSSCMLLSEPIVTISPKVREYLCLDPDMPEEDLIFRSEAAKALIQGCQGALKRGPVRSCALANVRCHIESIDAEGGLAAINSLPGAIRAAAAQAVTQTLKEGHKVGSCTAVEPTMSVEVTLPADMVGTVLSDITGRRGTVGDVLTGGGDGSSHAKALVRGDVPLVEILGYANSLRSLTGGEAAFSAEYKGHSPCS